MPKSRTVATGNAQPAWAYWTAKKDYAPGYERLGTTYFLGESIPADRAKAIKYLRKRRDWAPAARCEISARSSTKATVLSRISTKRSSIITNPRRLDTRTDS